MMRWHSYYDLETGELVGRTFSSNIADDALHAAAVTANTPEGCGQVEGQHDHTRKRVDLTGEKPVVVDRADAAPDVPIRQVIAAR